LIATLLSFAFLGQFLTDRSETINEEEEDCSGQQSLGSWLEALTDVVGNGETEPRSHDILPANLFVVEEEVGELVRDNVSDVLPAKGDPRED
jgi:hypothetical protein